MTDRLKALADSYLDHIRIAIEADDRGAPYRDFLDNWNAYRCEHAHHRTRSDRVIWFNNPNAAKRLAMLESLDFRSRGAVAIIDHAQSAPGDYLIKYSARDRSAKLIIDHAVPIAVIVSKLFLGDTDLSRDGLRDFLTRWYRLGLLSHEENCSLDECGLRSAMPTEWDGRDPFARYRHAGIEPG